MSGTGADDECPTDYFALKTRDPDLRFDNRLRPYRNRRDLDCQDPVTQRLAGSAIAAAWPHILCFALYGIGITFFFDHVIEEQFPDAFDVPFDQFIGSAMFAIGFFLSAKVFGALGKYATGINVFFNSADAIGTSWLHIQAQTKRYPLNKRVLVPAYSRPSKLVIDSGTPVRAEDRVCIRRVQQINIIEDLQDIWRAMIFALKFNFRTQATRSRFESSTSADVNLAESSVNPFKLPMAEHLQNELAHYETDYITGLLDMASYRYTILINSGAFQREFSATAVHVNAVGTQVAIMSALQVLGLPPPVADLLYAGLVVVFLLHPWVLWPTWRYVTIAIYLLELIFFFSLWGISNKIGNPYNRFDDSPFIYHDIGGLSRDVARNVDDQADKFIAEVVATHRYMHQESVNRGEERDASGDNQDGQSGGGGTRIASAMNWQAEHSTERRQQRGAIGVASTSRQRRMHKLERDQTFAVTE